MVPRKLEENGDKLTGNTEPDVKGIVNEGSACNMNI